MAMPDLFCAHGRVFQRQRVRFGKPASDVAPTIQVLVRQTVDPLPDEPAPTQDPVTLFDVTADQLPTRFYFWPSQPGLYTITLVAWDQYDTTTDTAQFKVRSR
jgi:hypothetical protein